MCYPTPVAAEWDTVKNAAGHVIHSGKTALIQIGYKLQGESLRRALLIRTFKLKELPRQLIGLLLDARLTVSGKQLGGDLAKIARDFTLWRVVNQMRTQGRICELGLMARKRGVVTSGTAGLDKLAAVLLNKTLRKDVSVRLSQWSASKLSTIQEDYGALDAIASLEVHDALNRLPDLSVRLSPSNAILQCAVDVVPSHGSVTVMAVRAATGKIVGVDGVWTNTVLGTVPQSYNVTTTRRQVEVTEVLAPAFVVPGLKTAAGGVVTLGDFGSPPFTAVLPLSSLAPHVELAADHPRHRADPPPPPAAPTPPPAAPPPPPEPPTQVEDDEDEDGLTAEPSNLSAADVQRLRVAMEAEPTAVPALDPAVCWRSSTNIQASGVTPSTSWIGQRSPCIMLSKRLTSSHCVTIGSSGMQWCLRV
jgi:hypothetical protein